MQTVELRRRFLEAMQLWIKKTASYDNQVTTLLPSNQQLQKSDVIVKEPIHLKRKDKTNIISTLPSRYANFFRKINLSIQKSLCPPIGWFFLINRPHLSDLQSTIAYTFRHEVSLHSIVSGAAFNALFQFCQLLEQVNTLAIYTLCVCIL